MKKNKWVWGFLAGSALSGTLALIWWGGTQLLSLGNSKGIAVSQSPSPIASPSPISPLTQENGGLQPPLIPTPPPASPSPEVAVDETTPAPTLPSPNLGSAKALPVLNPNRVEFANGAKDAQLTGNLDSLLTQPFWLDGRQGQTLTISPTSSTVSVNVFAPDGVYLGSTSVSPDQKWSSQLTQSGTYRLEVNVSTSGPYEITVQLSS